MENYTFEVKPGTKKIVLTEPFRARCPICGEMKTLKEFGLRNMGNGEVRNQPRCGPCRKLKGETR